MQLKNLPMYPNTNGYCGDGVLQAGEQCEAGIPCPNQNDVCNLATCQCISDDSPPNPHEKTTVQEIIH